MDYYRLGKAEWWQTQAYYHALAEMGREGLIICYPRTPYVCLGLHDDLEQEIDQDYCKTQRLPLLRRETGGGVVYLDNRQIFFQLVLNSDNPILPLSRMKFYKQFLAPALRVCHRLGIKAAVREPADIVIDGQKCSGNASGDIGEGVAYVGNLLINFDCEIMCNVLKTPSPHFKQCLQTAMNTHLSNLSEWGQPARITHENLITLLEKEFSYLFQLERRHPDEPLKKKAETVFEHLTDPEWLKIPGRKRTYRRVKIAEEVYLVEYRLADDIGLTLLVKEGIITRIDSASGTITANRLNKCIGTQWKEDFII